MLLIYSKPVPNRLKYIARLLLTELFGIETEFTDQEDVFSSFAGPKINYSAVQLAGGLNIVPAPLLFGTGVVETPVDVEKRGEEVLLFPSGGGDLPLDPFAASFFLVTRFEEYENSQRDKYGRFDPAHSLARKYNFLDRPVVNLWARMLTGRLLEMFPGLAIAEPSFRYTPTIDVDHAFAYHSRTVIRTLGGIGRSISRAEFGKVADRLLVISGFRDDPFDTFAYIRKFHADLDISPLFFILFADYGGKDNNVTLRKKRFRHLLATLADERPPGIHPSLSSNRSPGRLESEINGLSAVTGREITASRQHFLKFSFPRTFRHLVSYGITDDYSMGYASDCGFRAGIASPFRFFDLYRNEMTPLVIHPVAAMDVTFRDYLHLGAPETSARIRQLADSVRAVNGEFVSLWHNESLSEQGRWKGWRNVFEETTAYAAGLQQ